MEILAVVEKLVAMWQQKLGDTIKVILGGSLVSGLFIFDKETELIDVDVRFLADNPEDLELRQKIEFITGLKYRKTITVNDWPTGQSVGIMVEGQMSLPELPLPLDIEGCIRNPKYVGWARFYRDVLTKQELEAFRQKKIALRHDKTAYKQMKAEVRAEVERRCLERGIVSK